ncbi:hypothetical protein L873DRAFT_1810804 [Choiromyces venosus 120613-1]|uniref:Uncharacterized protein n=1 Tax=Choiromyces venosus 120613-1 TaxID=1336337 RepID=A0A3N4JES9_9PEZI|nr:hypothetical protein L873DRAFT_1810804 [Choiromyces venosus 120613-1]
MTTSLSDQNKTQLLAKTLQTIFLPHSTPSFPNPAYPPSPRQGSQQSITKHHSHSPSDLISTVLCHYRTCRNLPNPSAQSPDFIPQHSQFFDVICGCVVGQG